MLWTHGWKNDNIHILFGEGNEWDDPNGNQRYNALATYGLLGIVDYSAYRQDVDSIFTWLKEGNPALGIPQMTEEDFLFVWTYSHGTPDVLLLMGNDSITSQDLAALADSCAYEKRVVFMQQCHGGSFIDNLENEQTFIMTAVDIYQLSTGSDNDYPDPPDTLENECFIPDSIYYNHEECFYHTVNAVRLQTIVGNPLASPDVNSDGLASLTEVWEWVDSTNSYEEPTSPVHSDLGSMGDSTFLNIQPYKPTGLTGERIDNDVKLTWNKNLEFDFDHYEIFKRVYDDSSQQYQDWFFLDETRDTTYTDPDFAPSNQGADTVWYKIAAVDQADQSSEFSDAVSSPGFIRPQSNPLEARIGRSEEHSLEKNHPDPFNVSTTISYSIPEASFVELKVYDIAGKEVATLVHSYLPEGLYKVSFKVNGLPSGIYFYQLKSGSVVLTRRMVLLK